MTTADLTAKIFWSGHSQAVRLPKTFRFAKGTSEVAIRREGDKLILEPAARAEWPESFWQAFGELPDEFERPVQHNEEAAREGARIRAHLDHHGTPIGDLDSLIAAQALASGLILVTNNLREFQRVPRLRTENWAVSTRE